LIVGKNPGAGKQRDGLADAEFLKHLEMFKNGRCGIEPAFEHQRRDMRNWGGLNEFYMDGFGLKFDEVAFVNIAWCGTSDNSAPKSMLNSCFERFTGPLIRLLDPNVILLGGSDAQGFTMKILRVCPGAKIEPVLHFSHRPLDRHKRPEQIARVRSVLAAAGARRH
jgi:hypothetical protein